MAGFTVPRWLLLCIPLALAWPACATRQQGSGSPRAAATIQVQLLAINDLHGQLEPPAGANGRINAVEAGGVEYLATHLKQAIAQQPNSLVVAAGDLVGASPLVSSAFHDEPAIEALNAMGLSVTSVGNHEFDEGHDELLRLQRGGCHLRDGCQDADPFDGAAFEYLAANVVRKAGGGALLPGTTVRTVGGVKVGFIGATTRETAEVVPASVGRDLAFLDEAETANARAVELKRQGVHAIVLLIHEGLRPGVGADADPNGCAARGGGLEQVVSRLSDDIAVVISGHSHAFYNCRIGQHLVTSASSFGRMLTRVSLEVDSATGRVLRAAATNQVVTRDVARDPALSKIIGKYSTLVQETARAVVGSVVGDLKLVATPAGETPLGRVIADAQLAATNGPGRDGAAVAFMNRGGIRGDIVAGAGASAERPSPVTYGDLYTVQPFGNQLMTFTMTGDMIKRLLEQQFDNPAPGRAQVLQVSQGFAYRYRAAGPRGQRVDADSIQINGRRITPADRVRVAASDFLRNGGDGFTVFGEGTDSLAVVGDIDALVDYFKARSPISAPPENRILRTD